MPEVAHLTLYMDDEDNALGVARAVANYPNVYAVLVADECLESTAFQLGKILQGVENRVRLVTIDNALERGNQPELRLNRLTTSTVEKIVETNFPNIDQIRLYQYCRLAEGYLRFAIFLCDNDALIAQQGHLGTLLNDAKAYLATLFGGDGAFDKEDYTALMVISLVERCGVVGNAFQELEQLCALVRLDPKDVSERLHRMQKANGLVARADLYFFEEILDMISGEVTPPGIFLKAAEVLRRQLAAFCLDDWVTTLTTATALPDKTSSALDAVERADKTRFPYTFIDHVLTNEPRLSQAFLELLGSDIDDRVRERLIQFLQGTGEDDGLRVRLLKTLEELTEERKLYRKRAEQIKTQISAVGQRPQDEATKNEIDHLRRERDKVIELAKEINQRDLLNTLTDAGLIPNYAFPEAGIELKSVLWRRKSSDDHTQDAYVALPAIRYERPASSALSEFAPENRFYANQRRVEIDQINMGLAKLE